MCVFRIFRSSLMTDEEMFFSFCGEFPGGFVDPCDADASDSCLEGMLDFERQYSNGKQSGKEVCSCFRCGSGRKED